MGQVNQRSPWKVSEAFIWNAINSTGFSQFQGIYYYSISHTVLSFEGGWLSTVSSRAWTLSSTRCWWFSSHRSCGVNWISKQSAIAYCYTRYPATSCLPRICHGGDLFIEPLPSNGNPRYNILHATIACHRCLRMYAHVALTLPSYCSVHTVFLLCIPCMVVSINQHLPEDDLVGRNMSQQ
jgi:hypothetical protein